jgi:hypothetical protein
MRSAAFVLVTTLVIGIGGAGGVGCGTGLIVDASHEKPDAQAAPPADAAGAVATFQIVGPTLDINPSDDITYCYYFHTPNTSDLAIKKWASHLTAGVHDMVVYLTPGDLQAAGTVTTDRCGFSANSVNPVWTYSAVNPDEELALPSDDGNGTPVGLPLRAGHSGFIQMHFANSTAAVLHAHVELFAYAYDSGVQVTPAGSFYTYSTKIDLAPGSATAPTSGMVNGSCDVSPATKFFLISAYTHKQAVHTFVVDGAAPVFDTTIWDHPVPATWNPPAFYSFTSGKLTYQCEYVNPNNYRIQSGDNAATAETCMAVGFFFPSPGGAGAFCLNSAMVN